MRSIALRSSIVVAHELEALVGDMLGDGGDEVAGGEDLEAIRIKPDYDKARWNLGMAYVEAGDIANALKEYEVLKKSDKQHADELRSAIHAKSGQTIEQEEV